MFAEVIVCYTLPYKTDNQTEKFVFNNKKY